MKKLCNFNIPVQISTDDIIDALHSEKPENIIRFILDLDISQADTDFTGDLIRKLVDSYRPDFSGDKVLFESFIDSLKFREESKA